jgi:sulfoxide reductase heme-binding subunit YedZ
MSHTWWYLSRASGIVAWALLTLAMVWGLLLSTRMFDRRPSPKGLVDLHRFLGGIAVVFVGLHVGAIVADSYVHFGAADVLLPLATSWHPLAVAWGVIAMWILLAVEITSLAMRYIPRRVWKAVHLSSYALFVSATVHAFAAGPDTRERLFELVCVGSLAIVLFLIVVHVTGGRGRHRGRTAAVVAGRRERDRVTASA